MNVYLVDFDSVPKNPELFTKKLRFANNEESTQKKTFISSWIFKLHNVESFEKFRLLLGLICHSWKPKGSSNNHVDNTSWLVGQMSKLLNKYD